MNLIRTDAARVSVTKWCELAIKLYLDTLQAYGSGVLNPLVEETNAGLAITGAEQLATSGEVGVEVGCLLDDDMRLRCIQGKLSISLADGYDPAKEDREWERVIGGVFEEKGFPFEYRYQ